MSRFEFKQLVTIVQRELRAREGENHPRAIPTLFDELGELQGLGHTSDARERWDPMPRIKAMGKPILRAVGLYEPVRAWWKSR